MTQLESLVRNNKPRNSLQPSVYLKQALKMHGLVTSVNSKKYMGQKLSCKVKNSMMHVLDILRPRSSIKAKRTVAKNTVPEIQQTQNKKPALQRTFTPDQLQKITEAELALKRLQAEKKRLEDILNAASENHLQFTQSDNNNVRKETVKVPRYQQKVAFLLHNVFTSEECDELLKELQNNTEDARVERSIEVSTTHSEAMLNRLWPVLEHDVPQKWLGNKLIGLSDRCTLEKQCPGYKRKPHMDEAYEPIEGVEKSFLSIYVFLNDDYTGGESSFLKNWQRSVHDVKVKPTKGSIFVHQHNLLHEITTVESGKKHIARIDVMYNTEKRDVLAEMTDFDN